MSERTRIGFLFGGRSAEHEVSLRSAEGVLRALDRTRFEPVLIGVGRDGRAHLCPADITPTQGVPASEDEVDLLQAMAQCDVLFPLIHGPFGEDGKLQGVMEYAGVPYVGSGVFASALCMDKGHLKHWLASAGLPVGDYLMLDLTDGEVDAAVDALEGRLASLAYPLFVKPANLGSSVGIGRVQGPAELPSAVKYASQHDRRVVIEAGLDARELEVAILDDGRHAPVVSDVGEIILPKGRWYDYQTKYELDVARPHVPADISEHTRARARTLALEAFRSVQARGLARVDFFLERESQKLVINEINTLPGFTAISMYPKLMEHAGVPYAELIRRLAEEAMQRRKARG